MSAARARAFIDEHALGERVEKIVTDAPPLSDLQRDTLGAIFQCPDATTAGPDKPTAAYTHRRRDGLRSA